MIKGFDRAFIDVEIRFDLTRVYGAKQIIFTLELFAMAMLVKVPPSFLLKSQGMRKKMARLSGMLLTSHLSIIVAAASIGAQQELITPEAKGAIFPLVLLTCLLDPTVFKPTAKGEVKSA
ncbi:MAG: cation:proton antiporter [Desulfatiglandaceae bacterium]